MLEVDPSNEPNRPHISSDTINFKERATKIQPWRPLLSAPPACIPSLFFRSRLCLATLPVPLSVVTSASVWVFYGGAPESASAFSEKNALFVMFVFYCLKTIDYKTNFLSAFGPRAVVLQN